MQMCAVTGRSPHQQGPVPCLSLELDLTAELEQTSAHDLVRFQPRCPVPGVLRENRGAVERVIDIEIPAHPGPSEAENPGDADIELLEPIFVLRLRCDQVDPYLGGAAGREVTAEVWRDLRIARRVGRRDRNAGNVLIGRA